jgi:hypothetical protein
MEKNIIKIKLIKKSSQYLKLKSNINNLNLDIY